ncbi:MAG: GtrA family protein [Chitinophagaceae bacterium]|nr:GtrA family protein [Chitinophagaceae bacterium]
MATFIKANVASLSASAFDYMVTIALVTFFHVDPFKASITGTVCGGILNFFMGRIWVFQSRDTLLLHQALKYLLVWVGNLFLNAGGMFVLLKVLHLHYLPSKIAVSLIVGFGYNYFMQKKFVFRLPASDR